MGKVLLICQGEQQLIFEDYLRVSFKVSGLRGFGAWECWGLGV